MPSVSPSLPLDLTPVQSVRIFEVVEQRIRDQLSSGRLKPGDKLPPERELAELLQVGRNTVREALRSLENAGLLTLVRGVKGGAFIRASDSGRVTQAVNDLVEMGSISLDDLTEVRIHLLDAVVRLACERATDLDMTSLERAVQDTVDAVKDVSDAKRLSSSLEFYRCLAAATHNRAFAMLMDSISDPVVRLLGAVRYPARDLAAARKRFMACFRVRDANGACRELNALLMSLRDHASKQQARP